MPELLDKWLQTATEPKTDLLSGWLTSTEPEPIEEPEEEPTWWGEAWEKTKGFGEWLFPKGIQDLPRQYGAALQKGGMAAGEAMTWLVRLLPGNEDLPPYAEQDIARKAGTVAQAGAIAGVVATAIAAGVNTYSGLRNYLKDTKLQKGYKEVPYTKEMVAKGEAPKIKPVPTYKVGALKGKPIPGAKASILRPGVEVTRIVKPAKPEIATAALKQLSQKVQAVETIKKTDIIDDFTIAIKNALTAKTVGTQVTQTAINNAAQTIVNDVTAIIPVQFSGEFAVSLINEAVNKLDSAANILSTGIEYIAPEKEFVAPTPEAKPTELPEIAPKVEIEKVPLISEEPIELATAKQIRQAHVIAREKAMISEKGKMKPQYRSLAKMMVGKKSISEMTKDEATIFIDALGKLPEPTKNAMGELVPPSITKITALVPKEFFERKFKEPTVAKYLTSQTYYAEKLGIKSLVEPSEIGKQEFDLEFRNVNRTVDQAIKKIDVIGKTTIGEKITAKVKNIPTKAVANMAELLNKYEEPPETLPQEQKDIFNWFRSLSREIFKRENEVRKSLDFKPIEYKEAYLRHTADTMAKEMLRGEYPFPQGLKYWSEKIIGKKIFNPMEFQRKLSDDLIDLWTKDLAQATKSMLWSGLKEIHLAQPVKILSKYLNALSKDTKIYKDLTPEEKLAYQKSVIPASTKKWLINYENQVIKGQSTELDANVNRIITQSGLKGLFNKVLSPFGRTVGEKPITNMFQFGGRLTISGVMGWIPRQIIRNSFQSVQNLALYGVKATTKALLPVSITNDKNLKELLTDSIFLKSYTGFEELPANLMGKLERIWLAPYGAVAVFNAKTAMKAAYWDTLDLIIKPKYKDFGWADAQRTKDTPEDFLYPSEKEKLLKEMEFGSGATQYQYIPIGMPELFRHKALIPLTRLQSWWMNYFTKFTGEALHRAFKGETSYGAKLPWSRRVNYLKYLLIGGAILTGMGYKRSFLIGVLPTYLSPAGQVALGLYAYATAKSDWQRQQALRKIQFSWTAFIPGSLAWRDFLAVWNGDKEIKELFFYKQPEKKTKKRQRWK